MSYDDRSTAQVETPVNPYSLLEAVNASSDTVNTAWLIFLALMAYCLIAVAGVTHKDLLLETPVALPIMQVSIQLKQFFTFAPILIVLFHLGVVAQLVLLARKTIAFDTAVRLLESSELRTHPLRLELHNFFFVQAIAGPHRSRVVSVFLHGMSWLTTMILPVILLLYIQVSFLPYHDVTTTWVHRVALLFDLCVLLLIGTFLLSTETSFFQAVSRNARRHPFNVSATVMVLLFLGFLSFFVATVPGELLDQTAQVAFGAPKPEVTRERAQTGGGGSTFVKANIQGSLFGLFRRNLVVTDADLVNDKDLGAEENSISLRGRDLRFARLDRSDLHQADFTGADLTEASLINTDLRRIALYCTDLNELILTENREAARCALARRANFTRAQLDGARLMGTDFTGASFDGSELSAADLRFAQLTATSFVGAHLDKADITGGVHAEGASLLYAKMDGVDLTGAQLQGADLSSASLEGAILSFAQLQGALFRTAELEGASLHKAKLQGADFTGTKVKAADLRGATVWMTVPPLADESGLADTRDIQIEALEEGDVKSLKGVLDRMRGERDSARVRDQLEPLISGKENTLWGSGVNFATWKSMGRPPEDLTESEAARLSDHLAGLMCRARGTEGAVATGVVRRAVAQQFAGDPRLVYLRAKRDDCLEARSVAEPLMRTLAQAAEAAGPLFSAAPSPPKTVSEPATVPGIQTDGASKGNSGPAGASTLTPLFPVP